MNTLAIICTLSVVAIVAVTAYGSACLSSGIFLPSICKLKNKKKILLTFDDGPSPHTPALLALLRHHNLHAIFFCIGKQIQQHPDIVKQIIADGHIIGNHTYHHNPFYTFWTTRRIETELRQCAQTLKPFGITPTLFRPPLGITNFSIATACRRGGYTCLGWSIRSLDTRKEDIDVVLRRINRKMHGADILLMHDRLENVSALTAQVIQNIHKRGFEIAEPNEIFKNKQ